MVSLVTQSSSNEKLATNFNCLTVDLTTLFEGSAVTLLDCQSSLNDTIEVAWAILQNHYFCTPEKMEIFYPSQGRVLAFNCHFNKNETVANFSGHYLSNKRCAIATDVKKIDSSAEGILLLGGEYFAPDSEFDLAHIRMSLHIIEDTIVLIYHHDHLNELVCKLILQKLQLVVTQILANDGLILADLSFKTNELEFQTIQSFFTPQVASITANDSMIATLEYHATYYGNKTAIIAEHKRISYRQLFTQVNYLTVQLQKRGIGVGDRVGFCMQSSAGFVVSLFAILQAGASFVPIDIDMPNKRKDYIIDQSQLKLLLIDYSMEQLDVAVAVLDVNQQLDKMANSKKVEQAVNRYCTNDGDAEAYVIFTSGSTGLPKGVSISKRSLEFYARTAISLYDIHADDIALQFSSIAFDAMIEEVFPTLLCGATLVVREHDASNNLALVLEQMHRHQVTLLNFPSSYWKGLIKYPNIAEELPKSVRMVIIGSESVTVNDLTLWQQAFPQTPQLVNTYGPTETTVVTTTYRVPQCVHQINCLIGQPIAGSRIYILDQHGEIAPIGAIGQIVIGGPGVTLGYINVEADEKFVDVFYDGSFVGQFYKSGDYGRYIADGNIEYLGRVDEQVKVGGFRVNLDEIKLHICEFDQGIEDVKMLNIKTDSDNVTKLVAVLQSTCFNDSEALLVHLRDALPAYMIPTILILDEFPKLVSGKVDVPALKQVYLDRIAYTYNHKLSDTENRIAKIWKNTLQTLITDKDKSFFEYGGNSIDTINVLNHINAEFSISIPHRSYFNRKLSIKNISEDILQRTDNKFSLGGQYQQSFASEDFVNWRNQQAQLNHQWQVEQQPPCDLSAEQTVLMTGASGFLGIHLLTELLAKDNISQVFCLVRGGSLKAVHGKLQKTALDNQLTLDVNSEKLTLIAADITDEHLGLSEQFYYELSHNVNSIMHCAAAVNMQLDYESLKNTNVEATRKLIEFATIGAGKTIHYISSMAVFDCYPALEHVSELTSLDTVNNLPGGYAQTKWVAEKMLLNARNIGVNSNIYRCGRIWGNQHGGAMPQNDLIWKFVGGCVELGCAPNIEVKLDSVPACFMAEAIIGLGFNSTPIINSSYNLANPNSVSFKTIYQLLAEADIELDIVDYSAWLSQIQSGKSIASIAFLFDSEDHNDWTDSYFRGRITEECLADIGLKYPALSSSTFVQYIERSLDLVAA